MKKNKDGAPICETEEEFMRELKMYRDYLFRVGFYGAIAIFLPIGVSLLLTFKSEPKYALFLCFVALYTLKATPSLEDVMKTRPIPPKKDIENAKK